MFRPKSGALSILERAQGQLTGKRFGKKTPLPSHQRNESDEEEEDELKAYLSQLQQRTSQQPAKDTGDDSDESYHPVAHSTPLKSGSQFLKSSRATVEAPPQHRGGRQPDEDKENEDLQHGISSSDTSEQDFDANRFSRSKAHSKSGPKVREDERFAPIPTRKGKEGPVIPKLKKSAAFERIMSNFISDEEDIDELIRDADSPKRVHLSPDEPEAAPAPDADKDTTESIASFSDEEEILPGVTDGSGKDEPRGQIFRAEDLEPVKRIDTKHGTPTEERIVGRSTSGQNATNNLFTRTGMTDKISINVKKKKGTEEDVLVEEILSESEIKTVSETATKESDKVPNRGPQRSDDDTDVDASSYSSIASQHPDNSPGSKHSPDSEVLSKETVSISYVSQSLSTGTISGSRRSNTSSILINSEKSLSERSFSRSSHRSNARSKSSHAPSRRGVSESHRSNSANESSSRSSHSSYSEDFASDETNQTGSQLSSGTLTPSSVATVKHSPAPPATQSPTPRRHRTHRIHVTDASVQTAEQPHGRNHWIFDRTSSGHNVDVTELLKDYRTFSVPPETLQAVSSVDYSTMLLHQTMKLQFEQTQQSIQRMLGVHQALLESVHSDYKYTTLEDTKAYIQQQREKRNKEGAS